MKRKTLILITVCILALAFGLVACNKTSDDAKSDNICRLTEQFYAGESENFYASIECGRREKTFIADGVAREVADFCELCILPLKSNSLEGISYQIWGGQNSLSGEVKAGRHGEFVASIALDFIPEKIVLTASDNNDEIELSSVLDGAITAFDAINVAKDALKENIQKEYNDGKPEREIYVKLISADRVNYYYYVSFIGDGVDYWAMLINPKTGEIVSKKS